MSTKHNNAQNVASPNNTGLLVMSVGFVIFISGFFLVTYSFFAWLLVANRYEALAYFICGVVASFIGRKIIRFSRRQQDLVNIS